jgi:hypothetical protein
VNIKESLLKIAGVFIKFIGTFTAEIFFVAGCFFVVLATFEISRTAGFYVLGAVLLTSGIFFANTKRQG